jgi:hypothetical protein
MRRPFILFSELLVGIVLTGLFASHSLSQTPSNQSLPFTSEKSIISTSLDAGPSVSITPVFPGLGDFSATVINGDQDAVVGIYVEKLFALPVTQQPQDQPSYVSDEKGLLTQFELPAKHGVVGILAHNTLSGSLFSQLAVGDEVVVIYGDGRSELYIVAYSESYQALDPESPYSKFININGASDMEISSAELYNDIYGAADRLVFQTCIEANGDPSWGRLFVTAVRDDSVKFSMPGLYFDK